uniref:Ferric-chelate reductase 1 n=1 Tax=Panagrolaimus superbus TaxID=310955 RepID=A0A914YSI5_9BILA
MYQRISLLLPIFFFFLFSISLTFAQSGFDTSECGKTKHCISVPANCHQHSNEECQYMISHSPTPDGKSVILELFGKREAPDMQYVAAGFSEDDIMGEEPVVACVSNPNGNTLLSYSYNQGKSNHPNVGVDKSDAELIESVVTDAVIYCKIRQAVTPTNEALPNLSSNYQLLVARGPRQENGQLSYHSERQAIPLFTNFMTPLPLTAATIATPVNQNEPAPSAPGIVIFPNQTNSLGNNNNTVSQPPKEGNPSRPAVAKGSGPLGFTSATKLTIVKWHGFLMLLAWFGMIAIGIFSARYLKPGIPNTKIGGIHLWFHLHRALNFTAVLIIIVSTILIFIGKDLSWTGPILGAEPAYNWNPGAIHTVFGVVAILLALMQPLGALARCGPDHPRRPLFNWGHRTLGLIGIISALIAAYIAITKFHVWSNADTPTVLVIIYIISAVLLILALEIFTFSRLRSRRKVALSHRYDGGMELQRPSKYSEDGFDQSHSPTREGTSNDKLVNISGFLLFSVISIAFVVLLTLFLL